MPTKETMEAACRDAGIVPAQHCCLELAYSISKPGLIKHQGPNRIIDWLRAWDEYQIPMPYDGYSATQIQDVPPEYNSDAWWRKSF